ncbi:F0F1 ATP synthase subunit epsilon [Nitrosomonas ureae]|uniref:ATP synthase epsilon chain n=1 Tax=Nitrosomonas ureae TaxID=44577 RepID=A0A0S3AGN9_9PROT|nr:F0F1 ATP synthase subunit epsilon [Nitrosomonas ureae]ALQ50341.1 ATP synthase F0F1 subunit epsilon [Nitrosomonas ureae]PTQ87416.1 ATP synthase F1 subcomplex epsilon subunit [Nitrosomonas ureae]PXX18459.1 ATP synthase F1 subcomplex epsilon subunit [Nitrosomonas ureae]SDT88047.1 ATP synthase F1 subcomplex epsilon subunit [Nitrosomonas ureae]SEP65582.1 F-type H+-transporting ATPase subunit epsilon [Nitrosomonas ureae]
MGTIFHLDIVSAEESIYSGPVEFMVAPAQMGEVGIYPRHTPMLTKIKSGMVRIKAQLKEEELIYVSGGMLEVQPDIVTILADTAVRSHDLDEAKALEVKRAAEEAMKNKESELDYVKAQAELIEAMAQLAAIDKLRKRGH